MNHMENPNITLYGTPGIDWPTIEKGVEIEEGTRIGQNTYIGMNVKIGKNCRIMQHVTICKDAVIGNDVFIGPNSSFLNDKYPPTQISQPPVVGSHAVIGGGVTLCPGVVIGFRAVVGAGSNVTKDVPDEEVWIGNPARLHMNRDEYDRRQQELEERLK